MVCQYFPKRHLLGKHLERDMHESKEYSSHQSRQPFTLKQGKKSGLYKTPELDFFDETNKDEIIKHIIGDTRHRQQLVVSLYTGQDGRKEQICASDGACYQEGWLQIVAAYADFG